MSCSRDAATPDGQCCAACGDSARPTPAGRRALSWSSAFEPRVAAPFWRRAMLTHLALEAIAPRAQQDDAYNGSRLLGERIRAWQAAVERRFAHYGPSRGWHKSGVSTDSVEPERLGAGRPTGGIWQPSAKSEFRSLLAAGAGVPLGQFSRRIDPWPPPAPSPEGWVDPRSSADVEDPPPQVTPRLLRGRRQDMVSPWGEHPLPQSIPPEQHWWFSPKCCVKKFEYPSVVTQESTAVGPAGGRVGWGFKATAEFKEEWPCWCECCEFRQFVEGTIIQVELGPNIGQDVEVYSTGGEPVEDCNLLNPKRPNGYAPAAWAGEPQPGDVPDGCYGKRPGKGEYPHYPGGEGMNTRDEYENACLYRMWDKPGVSLKPGRVYLVGYQVRFLGVIFDRCRNYTIKRLRSFYLAMAGIVWAGMPADKIPGFAVASDSEGKSIGSAMPTGVSLG